MNLKKIISIVAVALSFNAHSLPLEIDTSLWTDSISPSSSRLSINDTWSGLHSNTPKKLANSSGALISNFTTSGDFQYSGMFMPTFAQNPSCEGENTCDDDDILGLVFGWQDASNHYRLGWSQGDGTNASGVTDITGKTGLFLVKEQDGISNTLANWDSDFWLENIDYTFSIARIADSISFMIEGVMQNISGVQGAFPPVTPASGVDKSINFSLVDTTFSSGRVGVYTESQTAVFKSLNVSIPAPVVDVIAPATLGLAMLGGLALIVNRRKAVKRLAYHVR